MTYNPQVFFPCCVGTLTLTSGAKIGCTDSGSPSPLTPSQPPCWTRPWYAERSRPSNPSIYCVPLSIMVVVISLGLSGSRDDTASTKCPISLGSPPVWLILMCSLSSSSGGNSRGITNVSDVGTVPHTVSCRFCLLARFLPSINNADVPYPKTTRPGCGILRRATQKIPMALCTCSSRISLGLARNSSVHDPLVRCASALFLRCCRRRFLNLSFQLVKLGAPLAQRPVFADTPVVRVTAIPRKCTCRRKCRGGPCKQSQERHERSTKSNCTACRGPLLAQARTAVVK